MIMSGADISRLPPNSETNRAAVPSIQEAVEKWGQGVALQDLLSDGLT